MKNTIPKKSLVALPDFKLLLETGEFRGAFKIVEPEEAFVPAFDRSFHFGDSVYEVVRTYQGAFFSLEEHLRRLRASAKIGRYAKFPDENLIRQMILETCKCFYSRFGNKDLYVRFTVSRGIGDLNIDPKYASDPYPIVIVKELDAYPVSMYENGVEFSVVARRRNPPEALDPAMKSGNYLNNILAISEAAENKASDALMLSTQGFVTEGTTNNFFMIKNNILWTAPLSIGILAGITRDWIFEICKNNGIKYEERLFTVHDLNSADEMFLSSTTKEIVPITKLDGKNVGSGKPGALTKKLGIYFKELVSEKLKNEKSFYL